MTLDRVCFPTCDKMYDVIECRTLKISSFNDYLPSIVTTYIVRMCLAIGMWYIPIATIIFSCSIPALTYRLSFYQRTRHLNDGLFLLLSFVQT